MPCRSDYYCEDCQNSHDSCEDCPYTSKKIEKNESIVAPANLLCEACEILEDKGILMCASKELRAWYKKHEDKEADRIRFEAAEKLSERERRLLGIDLKKLRSKVT